MRIEYRSLHKLGQVADAVALREVGKLLVAYAAGRLQRLAQITDNFLAVRLISNT